MSLVFHRKLLGSIAVACLLTSAAGAQDAVEKINPQYIPANACAAAVVDPQRALARKDLELLPREIMAAAGEKELGFDPTQIRRFIGFVVAGETLREPPQFGMILRFDARPKLSEQLVRGTTKGTLEGRPYFKADDEQLPSFYMPDANTLLIAPDPVMQKMVKAKDVQSPLVKLLAASPPGDTATAYVAVEQIKAQLKEASKQAPLPEPLQPLLSIPDDLKSLRLDLDVQQLAVTGKVTMTAYDAAAAQRLDKVLQDSLKFGISIAKAQMSSELDLDDPVQKATLAYINRLGGAFEELLKPQRQGATLVINLDGQIASPGVLVALLLPAVQAARESARRLQSSNNLKQISLAMHGIHSAHGALPPAAIRDQAGKPLLSWRVQILPYLEQQDLYDQFHLDEPWDSEHNKKLLEKMPAVYRNPNTPSGSTTNYLAVTGKGTMFDGAKGISFDHVKDGLTNTIMVVEADPDRAVEWTRPSDLEVDFERPLAGLGHLRAGGFQATLGDGSVHFISNSIDPQVLKALFTRSGREVVSGF
jgi:hypothetical protein